MHIITEEGLVLSVKSLKRKDRGRKLQRGGGGLCVTKRFLSSLLLNLTKGFSSSPGLLPGGVILDVVDAVDFLYAPIHPPPSQSARPLPSVSLVSKGLHY